MTKSRLLKYALLGIAAALIAHYLIEKEEKPKGHPRDYAEIAAEGIIHASTEYNSISFYVDDDTLSGFHYELIEAFCTRPRAASGHITGNELQQAAGRPGRRAI